MKKNIKLNKFNNKLIGASIFLNVEHIAPFVKNGKDMLLSIEIEQTKNGIVIRPHEAKFSVVNFANSRKRDKNLFEILLIFGRIIGVINLKDGSHIMNYAFGIFLIMSLIYYFLKENKIRINVIPSLLRPTCLKAASFFSGRTYSLT